MGLYDRQYMHGRTSALGGYQRSPGQALTTGIILLNVGAFLLDRFLFDAGYGYQLGPLLMGPLTALGHFSASTTIAGLQLWRLVSFQFLHANMGHLIFNMLGLFFFGSAIESHLGWRRFLTFYLLCGMMGAAAYLMLWLLGFLVSATWVPLVGASAGIFGVLAASTIIAPDAKVVLVFPPISVRLRTLAWVLIGIGLVTILRGGPNAGGEAAHLGGAVAGYFLIRRPQLLNFVLPRVGKRDAA
jgi:membrane associated rhomboid family serine protease